MAMGGEGGGVLADWIVAVGESNGFIAQVTSVPGVAQRTGATIYYLELFPQADADAAGQPPVLALMPAPGEVDIVIASELMEAGRAVQRGLVTQDRTTLIASTHRVYSMTEKIAMGDGRVNSAELIEACGAAARDFVAADFAALAEQSGSLISAVLFGALAGSARIPLQREPFEAAIRQAGVGVQSSLAAFEAGYSAAQRGIAADRAADAGRPGPPGVDPVSTLPAQASPGADPASTPAPAVGEKLRPLAKRINREFPPAAHATLMAAIIRLADYQDLDYASDYVDRLNAIRDLDRRHGDGSFHLLDETARHLALWMSYEDIARVADLKCRAARFDRVGREVQINDSQLLDINEFLHPRIEEIADALPAGAGRWLSGSTWARGLVGRFTRTGRIVKTSSVRGFALMYAMAQLRRIRRRSLRFAVEHGRIEQWLARIEQTVVTDPPLAMEIAQCQRLVKGYGDTHARGWGNFERLMAALPGLRRQPQPALALQALRDAALADESGAALSTLLARVQPDAGQ